MYMSERWMSGPIGRPLAETRPLTALNSAASSQSAGIMISTLDIWSISN